MPADKDQPAPPSEGPLAVRIHTGTIQVLAKPDSEAANNTIWNITMAVAGVAGVTPGSDEFIHGYRTVEVEYEHLWHMRRLIASSAGEGVRAMLDGNILALSVPDHSQESLEGAMLQIVTMTHAIADVLVMNFLTLAALDGMGQGSAKNGSRVMEFRIPVLPE